MPSKQKSAVGEPDQQEVAPDHHGLTDLRIPFGERDGVGFDQISVMVLEDANLLAATAMAYAEGGSAEEALLVHAVGSELKTIGDDMIKAWRPRMEALAKDTEDGKIETELGSIRLSIVKDSTRRVFTDATRELLEEHGVLSKGCNMSASLKQGVTLDSIPSADLQVLEKYFEISLHLDEARVNALVELGHVKPEDLDATCEEQVVRAGSPRLTVRPSDTLLEQLRGD